MSTLTVPTAVLAALPTFAPLVFWAGDDYSFTVQVTNFDGTPTDMSGRAPHGQIRVSSEDQTVLATFTITVSAGLLACHLAAADSAALPPSAVYDVQLTGPVRTVAAGAVSATREVTR
jgi:hypothetical protein